MAWTEVTPPTVSNLRAAAAANARVENVTVDFAGRTATVRYYERNGLLTPRTRLASGYRRQGSVQVARLRFIHPAQALGSEELP